MKRFINNIPVAVALAFLASGCATTQNDGLRYETIANEFEEGKLRLTCGVSCTGAYGASRAQSKAYYDNELWTDLAVNVARVGFEVDQAYFYLGRAAEGLGFSNSALVYYRLSRTVYECDGWVNNCDGLDVPHEVDQAIMRTKDSASPSAVSSRVAHVTQSAMSVSPQVSSAMSKSDDYIQHKTEFDLAGQKLIDNGTCSIEDLEEYGGFWKSAVRESGYFIDCKGKRVNYTLGDLSSAAAVRALPTRTASELCRGAITDQMLHAPPDFHVLDHATQVFGNGNVGVTQGFTGQNGLGMEIEYRAYCIVTPSGRVEIQSMQQK